MQQMTKAKLTQTMTTPSALRTASPSPTRIAAVALAAVVGIGTLYSVLYDTALDTSDPASYWSLPPDGQTPYFAQRSNIFNVYFVKRAWGWTSVAFFGMFFTSPTSIQRPTRRIARWVATTLVWALFAAWFFGPSLFDRINSLSGAQCLVRLPGVGQASSPADPETFIVVSPEYCQSRTLLTPSSHPAFFAENPDLARALTGTAAIVGSPLLETLKLKPKLFRGHDVSGHLFLLTLSVLFLADQLTPSLKLFYPSIFSSRASPTVRSAKEQFHIYAINFSVALIALWLLMCLTTSVYFHTVGEKVTGFGEFSDFP
jgi:Fat storage-inducing transmembrane protein